MIHGGVAAGDGEADCWEFWGRGEFRGKFRGEVGVGYEVFLSFECSGVEVCLYMVDADEGFVEAPCECFCGGDANDEGADESGAVAYGDGVDV